MLKALALPADNVPARIVIATKVKEGRPLAAKTMAGRVVTRSSSTTRSFIRSRYPRAAMFTRQDYSANAARVHSSFSAKGVTLQLTKGSPYVSRSKA